NINRIQRLFAHPIPWGYGFAQKDLSVEPGKAILAGTEKAALQYLQMASDPSAQGFLQFLVQSFYEIVRVPEMNPGEVQMGAQSGFALRILYSDLLEKTQTKRRLYGEVLEEVSRRALEMMGHGRDVEVSIDWQEPLPIMETEQASALGFDLSTGIVSKETVANRRGYDYGVEQEKIKAERQEAAQQEMNLGAFALANYEQGKTGGLLPLSGGAQGLPGGLGEVQTPIQAVPGGKPQ
ncbi:MAG: phage portal protein, partial [Chloroflexi bacterium]|nr:phage portal protein [Chloroflexota bacterium]